MNRRAQRICAWSGIALILLFFLGFWVIAGFMPPPNPLADGSQLAATYIHHTGKIQAGLMIGMFAIGLLPLWSAVLTVQMKRIEGRNSVWAYAQLAFGATAPLIFIFPMFLWETIAFRPHQSPELVRFASDTAWLPFVAFVETGVPWLMVVGAAILGDRQQLPIFPRWSGHYCFVAGALITPGTTALFVKKGPFAWDGAISFWMVIIDFAVWLIVMTVLLLRAINRQASAVPAEDVASAPSATVPAPVSVR